MGHLISLALIACGLFVAIPAFLDWLEVIRSVAYGNVQDLFQQARHIFTRMIMGSVVGAAGIALLIWTTMSKIASRSPSIQTISITNSPNAVLALAECDAVVTNIIRDLKQSNHNDAKAVADPLLGLKSAINNDQNLPYELKMQALEQVKVIGEAASAPSGERKKGHVQQSILVLKGIVAELPKAIEFARACSSLLPKISSLLGLV